MFEQKVTIIFAIVGIVIIVGFICGVAPGIFLSSYVLLGIGAGFLLLILILLIITMTIVQYQDKKQIVSNLAIHSSIFNKRLSKNEKIQLIFTILLIFIGGALVGVLCVLLLKAVSASTAVYVIIAAIFIIALLTLLIVILILALKDPRKSTIDTNKQNPVSIESYPRSQVLTKPQDEPRNIVLRTNRYHSRNIDDDSKFVRRDSPFNDLTTRPTNSFNNRRPPSTIQREYQRLIRPQSRFYVNDKVFVNGGDLAQIIEADGHGNYKLQYLDNGISEFRNAADLRTALPLIS